MNKRELQKQETLMDILKVSEELFQEIGYERTTIQLIADRCGLSKGALYHHFKSKEEVLERICQNHYNFAVGAFLPIVRESGQSMLVRMKRIMTIARTSQMNTATASFVKGDSKELQSVENAVLEKLFDSYGEKIYRDVFAPLLEEGRAAGECHFPGSSTVMAVFINHLDSGMSRQLNAILSHPEQSDAAEGLFDVIDGFSFALSKLLTIDKSTIDEITLADEMLEQYKYILLKRQSESHK